MKGCIHISLCCCIQLHVAIAQNTETSTSSDLVSSRYESDLQVLASPVDSLSSSADGVAMPSPSAGGQLRTRVLEFSELPQIIPDQLALIPDQVLDASQKRTSLLEAESQATLPNEDKYNPLRASALELADYPTPKIQALADQLGGDVVGVYKYVRDQIRTENQPKANKGAHMTLVLGSGGAGDKALLLYSLFRASGWVPGDEIRYVSATVKLPIVSKFCFSLSGYTGWGPQGVVQGIPSADEIQSLKSTLNTDAEKRIVDGVATYPAGLTRTWIAATLREHRWPTKAVPMEENYIEVERVWVKVKIDGQWVHLDPSFPRRTVLDVVNENAARVSNYNRQVFLSDFASSPPSPSSLIPNTGNIHRVGFSNLGEVRRKMKIFSEALYDQYRSGGEKSNLSMNDILFILREDHPKIETLDDLKTFGCPWRVGALGAGITDPLPTNPSDPGYPVESDFFPQHKHAWVLHWGWGHDNTPNKTRNLGVWGSVRSMLMPALMGKTLSMEQNQTSLNTGKAVLRLGGEEIYRDNNGSYGLGTGGSDICVLAIEGIPGYPLANATSETEVYVTNGNRPIYHGINDETGLPLYAMAPFAVYSTGANYRYAWTYLNGSSEKYLQECAERIEHLRSQEGSDNSKQIELESLNLMVYTYSYQYHKVLHLASGLSQASADCLHFVGAGSYVDSRVTIDIQSYYWAFNFRRTDAPFALDSWLGALGWLSSALEHSVVQQAHGGVSNNAFSTAKFIAKSSSSQPLYVLGPEMHNSQYGVTANDVAKVNVPSNYYSRYIEYMAGLGSRGPIRDGDRRQLYSLVLPHINGSSREGFQGWHVVAGEPWPGYTIGSAGGGISKLLTMINPLSLVGRFIGGLAQGVSGVSSPKAGASAEAVNPNSPNAHGNDPVDMRTGAFLDEHLDLSVSGQPSLQFIRYYNSDKSLDRSSRIGYGWTHNHVKRLAIRSVLGGQFGETGRPEDASNIIAAILVLKDLASTAARDTIDSMLPEGDSGRPALLFWNRTRSLIASACVATWAGDELVDSDAILEIGNRDYRFTRMVKDNGSYGVSVAYRSPIGLPGWKLIRNSTGKFILERRYGGQMVFSSQKSDGYLYCTEDSDVYGNKMVYTVQSDGRITKILSDPQGTGTGPSLAITYAADKQRILGVAASTDSASVQFGYLPAGDQTKFLLMTARPPVCTSQNHYYQYGYGSNQKMTTKADPQGRMVVQNFYGGDGRVHRQMAQGVPTQEWLYQWLPGMSKEINPRSHVTEFHYDERSRLVGIRDNMGNLTRYELDDEDRIIRTFGPDGQLVSSRVHFSASQWNVENGASESSHPQHRNPDTDPMEGVVISETLHAQWNATASLAGTEIEVSQHDTPMDVTTIYSYENTSDWHKGLPTSVTTTGKGTTQFRYQFGTSSKPVRDPFPYQIEDPMGRILLYVRDARGNITSEVGPDGQFARSYDARGRLVLESRNNGTLTRYNWLYEPHLLDGPSAIVDQNGIGSFTMAAFGDPIPEPASSVGQVPLIPHRWVFTYRGTCQVNTSGVISPVIIRGYEFNKMNAFGNIIESMDGYGDDSHPRITSTQYNSLGKVTRIVRPQTEAGRPVTELSYDDRGWQLNLIDAFGRSTTTQREMLDRTDGVVTASNLSVAIDYDEYGRSITHWSPMLRQTVTSYIGLSAHPKSMFDAAGNETKFWHNSQGNRVALTDRNGKQWRFAYDGLGRQLATRKPTGEMIHQTWRADRDLLASVQEPSGQTTQYLQYSVDGLLLAKKDGVNTGVTQTNYSYDSGRRLASVQENGQTITRSYDGSNLGQLKRYKNLRGEDFDYSFDGDGLLRVVFYPIDQNVVLPWTEDSKVLSFPHRKAVQYEYDSHRRLIRVTDWGGRVTRYKYDIGGRLREIIRHNGSICEMKYDAADRITEVKDRWQVDRRLISLFRLGFNNDGHLTSRFAIPFAYGLAGSAFAATHGDDNRLLTVGGQNVIHDLDGNLTSSSDPLYGGNMSLLYDARNRLINASMRGISSSHTYDAEGIRQTSTFGSQTTTYTTSVHGGLSQVLKRESTDGSVTWCVYGLGLLYEVVPDYENLTKVPNSSPVVHTAQEKTLVHHHDQIGNTVAVTDDQQRDVLWLQYDVYGAVVHAESPMQRDGSPPVKPEINEMPDKLNRALAVTPYLFSGQQGVMTDPTGLLYMRARYYHPGLRRFVNPDPIGFEGGCNWYAYAGGNPLMANDPSGLAVRNAGRNLGSAIHESGRQLMMGRPLLAAQVLIGGTVLTLLQGDLFNNNAQRASNYYVNGIFTGRDTALRARDLISGYLGENVSSVENRTFAKVGDILQIFFEEMGFVTGPSIDLANALRDTGGHVYMHSQGTSVGENAIRLLDSGERGSVLGGAGWGGQSFIQEGWGAGPFENVWRTGDPIPGLSPWNYGRYGGYTTFQGSGYGISNHAVGPYIEFYFSNIR